MNRNKSNRFFVSFLLLSLFVLCYQPGYAEDIELAESTGYLGVYSDGAKVGYSSWTFATKEVGKKKLYEFTMEERKKHNEEETVGSYSGIFKRDLCAKSFEYKSGEGAKQTVIKARCTGNNATVSSILKGSKFPDQKATITSDTVWEFCAPLVFGWRGLATDKPAKYSYITTKGARVNTYTVEPRAKEITFECANVTVTEWRDEADRVLLQFDGQGKLLRFVSTTKKGMKTEYVAENEEVAKSAYTFEEYRKAKREEDKKNGIQPKNDGKIEGDKKGLYKDCLAPVDELAADSEEGDYLKLEGIFSFQALEGWECEDVELDEMRFPSYERLWTVKNSGIEDVLIGVGYAPIDDEENRLDHDKHNNLKLHEVFSSVSMGLFRTLLHSAKTTSIVYSFWGKLKFPDGTIMYHAPISMSLDDDEYVVKIMLGQNDEYTAFAVGITRPDDETHLPDIYKMLGSLRPID